jgi:hypothetical protein
MGCFSLSKGHGAVASEVFVDDLPSPIDQGALCVASEVLVGLLTVTAMFAPDDRLALFEIPSSST